MNRDQSNAHAVRPVFQNENGRVGNFSGRVSVVTFGSEQYVWHSDGANSHPDPGGPPLDATVEAGTNTVFTLPKASITVLRGKLS